MRTALSVLLTCWPPGPRARKVSTSHCRNKSSFDSGNMIMFTSKSISENAQGRSIIRLGHSITNTLPANFWKLSNRRYISKISKS